MIDVSPQFNTLRYARAEGFLHAKTETLNRVLEENVPKGNVFEVARAAGITAAKRCSDWIVFCHPIPLDWIEVSLSVEDEAIRVQAEVRSVWKTGVEMEAISAVTAALLNAYDMLKPLDDTLFFTNVQVVKKKGGKNDFVDRINSKLPTAVLVISNSIFTGKRKDKSGKIIENFLENQPLSLSVYEILPDDEKLIAARLIQLVDEEGIRLIFTTGGTGLGSKDCTPEATRRIINREIPGVAEAIRKHGKDRTPFAMLSRELVGIRKKTLIINLPGSSKGAQESLDAIFPGILHAFPLMLGVGRGKHKNMEGASHG